MTYDWAAAIMAMCIPLAFLAGAMLPQSKRQRVNEPKPVDPSLPVSVSSPEGESDKA